MKKQANCKKRDGKTRLDVSEPASGNRRLAEEGGNKDLRGPREMEIKGGEANSVWAMTT